MRRPDSHAGRGPRYNLQQDIKEFLQAPSCHTALAPQQTSVSHLQTILYHVSQWINSILSVPFDLRVALRLYLQISHLSQLPRGSFKAGLEDFTLISATEGPL